VSGISYAVFLSYASQDAEAAKRICDALRAAGIEVWFDQSELRGGDVWDRQIRQQIHDCRLFIPIVSAHTEARVEGYFRREWKLAVDRTHDLSERVAFLVPLVIDSTSEAKADVPDAFRHVQWTRLPGGTSSPAFVERIRRLITPPPASALPGATAAPEYKAAQLSTATAGPRRVARVAMWALCGAVALGLAYLVADRYGLSKHTAAQKPAAAVAPAPTAAIPTIPEKSVAVLPFVDMSEKKNQEYFSDGLSEELIDMLTKIPDLRVPARTSSFYFKGKPSTIAEIAKTLGVAHVLEGSVRKSGNTLRITAQLIRADNGYNIWSETYDRHIDDIFKIQDDIASAVVTALKSSLIGKMASNTAGTKNADAYTLYLRARTLDNRSLSKEDSDTAAEYLRKAAALDPAFVGAWTQLVIVLCQEVRFQYVPPQAVSVEVHRAMERVLALSPGSARAHYAMAQIHLALDKDSRSAAADFTRAYELDPTDADNIRLMGHITASSTGDNERALIHYLKAIEVDPLNLTNYRAVASCYDNLGRFADALASYRKALELEPGYPGLHGSIAVDLAQLGRESEAFAEIQKEADDGSQRIARAWVYAVLGRKADAEAELTVIEQSFGAESPMDIAALHAYLGDVDQAFVWIDRAYLANPENLFTLKYDSSFKGIRDDPRYRALLRKMNLPE
jgi:TolB-like protein/tetratricopeptide (TPR) repeat protein